MKTSVAIIMPVLNEAAILESRITDLRQLQTWAELCIVDGGSADSTVALARTITPHVLCCQPGRALQMNRGAEEAHAEYLLFLHGDTVLPADFEAFIAALGNARPFWGFFPVQLVPGGRVLTVVERCINWRSRLTAVATGDQAIFVRRELFERLSGYAAIPLMEDVELSKRLRQFAQPFRWGSAVQTSSRRWQQRGVVPTVLQMWDLRLRYFLGASPQHLHARYYGKTVKPMESNNNECR